jgi:NTP pyrophosphatase (non-canonical NTP hydrolase)
MKKRTYYKSPPAKGQTLSGPRAAAASFRRLYATSARLQATGGCAWDRAQTTGSLLPDLVEEAWELFEAVGDGDTRRQQEELGDVFYTALFMAMLAERDGLFPVAQLLDQVKAYANFPSSYSIAFIQSSGKCSYPQP